MIGPYEFPPKLVWTNGAQKFSESFSLDRHWSIECSSHGFQLVERAAFSLLRNLSLQGILTRIDTSPAIATSVSRTAHGNYCENPLPGTPHSDFLTQGWKSEPKKKITTSWAAAEGGGGAKRIA